jgi:hypothetical protein
VLALFGAALGAVIAWLLIAFTRRNRGCQCTGPVSADAYDVLVEAEWATDADKVLAVPQTRRRRLRARATFSGP